MTRCPAQPPNSLQYPDGLPAVCYGGIHDHTHVCACLARRLGWTPPPELSYLGTQCGSFPDDIAREFERCNDLPIGTLPRPSGSGTGSGAGSGVGSGAGSAAKFPLFVAAAAFAFLLLFRRRRRRR